MDALNYLNQVITNKFAVVPVDIISTVAAAGAALGYCLCGGALSDDAKSQVLYLA